MARGGSHRSGRCQGAGREIGDASPARLATAGGVTFLNLEDETGMINVVCSANVFIRSKRTITSSAALIIRGRVERSQAVTNLVADKIERLPIAMRSTSRDWH
jgi:error-prone DNA polymerase